MSTDLSLVMFAYGLWLVGHLVFGWWFWFRFSRRFFYTQLVELTSHRGQVRYQLVHRFNIGLALWLALRLAWCMLSLIGVTDEELNNNNWWWHSPFYVHFSRHFQANQNDHYFLVTFVSLLVFSASMEAKLYLGGRVDTITWRKHHSLMVVNWQHYQQCTVLVKRRQANTNRSQQHGTPNDHTCWNRFVRLIRDKHLWSTVGFSTEPPPTIDMKKFARLQLPHLPAGIPVEMRLEYVRLLRVFELASTLVLRFMYVFVNILMCYYYLLFRDQMSVGWRPLVLLDLLLALYAVLRLIGAVLIIAWCTVSGSRLYGGILGRCRRMLLLQTTILVSSENESNPRNHLQVLDHCLRWHCFISHTVLVVNHDLWASVLLHSLAIHVPSNIYLIYRILLYRMPAWMLAIFWLVIVLQVVTLAGCLVPLAHSSKQIHRWSGVMHRVQLMLSSELAKTEQQQPSSPLSLLLVMMYKFKCLALYERIASGGGGGGRKYGITIGPSKTVTNRVIAQLFLVYIGYLISVIRFFTIESNKQT